MKHCKTFGLLLFLLWIGARLLTQGGAVQAGLRQGGLLFLDILLPALFPFLILTSFLTLSGLDRWLGYCCLPLTRLLRLPDPMATLLPATLLGGYPAGIQSLALQVKQRRLAPSDAARLAGGLCLPAPSFAILAVGERLLGNRSLGILLWGAAVLGTVTIWVVWIGRKPLPFSPAASPLPCTVALVQAVQQASTAMLSIGGYLLLAGVVLSLLPPSLPQTLRALISASLEVTGGVQALAQLSAEWRVGGICFFVTFGGGSVGLQLLALAEGAGIFPIRFWGQRLAAALCSMGWFWLLCRVFPTAASCVEVGLVSFYSPDRMLGGCCIAGMFLLLLGKFFDKCPKGLGFSSHSVVK